LTYKVILFFLSISKHIVMPSVKSKHILFIRLWEIRTDW